ncbi:acyl-CoA dehydrogenase family protein [Dactylosporangium roseum]|uniref:Acyl-CoA dehydrogenase family protein n=1 Tax=Dactylosporangium roseum TaxID=47989 RepID=A0ABY5YXE8_9ACTN|nr:acyl-CoA dehydrogenase family protein [Dactylosporangium roseum]UWZ34420.1 acyl-CoA dehydrogenase family protein [Dactylosporangium roseum]
MDFSLTEEQAAIRETCTAVLAEHDIVRTGWRDLPGGADWLDAPLWRKLVEAGIPELYLPQRCGGGDYGAIERCVAAESLGWHLGRVPLIETTVLAGMPLAAAGTPRADALLRDIRRGALVVGAYREPARPGFGAAGVVADAGTLTGAKSFVAFAEPAESFVVSAATPDGTGLFLVDPAGPGVRTIEHTATNGRPEWTVEFTGCPAEPLLAPGAATEDVLNRTWAHAAVASAGLLVGITGRALELSRAHVLSRRQFGRPLAEFQAVTMHMADAFIDVATIRYATYQAAWCLDHDRDDREVTVAQIVAGEASARVLGIAQHLHGGTGVDRDYPLHQFLRWAKHEELSYGSAMAHLDRLGDALAGQVPG